VSRARTLRGTSACAFGVTSRRPVQSARNPTRSSSARSQDRSAILTVRVRSRHWLHVTTDPSILRNWCQASTNRSIREQLLQETEAHACLVASGTSTPPAELLNPRVQRGSMPRTKGIADLPVGGESLAAAFPLARAAKAAARAAVPFAGTRMEYPCPQRLIDRLFPWFPSSRKQRYSCRTRRPRHVLDAMARHSQTLRRLPTARRWPSHSRTPA